MENNNTAEKRIGDFTVCVVSAETGINGPWIVVVYGGPHPRTLGHFRTEDEAESFLSGVSSRTLRRPR